MRIEGTLEGFHNTMGQMGQASSKIQMGFDRMLDRENPPTKEESIQFTTAFVEEDYLARVAQAQLKSLETQLDVMDTVLELDTYA